MRKPRDIDAELQALEAKAKSLRAQKIAQLGELVVATGADALELDVLTGALLAVRTNESSEDREAWRQRGAAFFQAGRGRRKASS